MVNRCSQARAATSLLSRPPPEQSPGHQAASQGWDLSGSPPERTSLKTAPIFVGIDISKVHLDPALRPGNPVSRDANDAVGIAAVVARLKPLAPPLWSSSRPPVGGSGPGSPPCRSPRSRSPRSTSARPATSPRPPADGPRPTASMRRSWPPAPRPSALPCGPGPRRRCRPGTPGCPAVRRCWKCRSWNPTAWALAPTRRCGPAWSVPGPG
jgi:hypothetical protein